MAHGPKEAMKEVQRWLPLSSFDRLFRKFGAVLWLVPFLLRCAATQTAGTAWTRRRNAHFGTALAAYLSVTGLRALIYLVHYTGELCS